MKFKDIKAGMKLSAVGDYADCIVTGDQYVAYEKDSGLYVACRGSGGVVKASCHHELASTASKGEIPELEPA